MSTHCCWPASDEVRESGATTGDARLPHPGGNAAAQQ